MPPLERLSLTIATLEELKRGQISRIRCGRPEIGLGDVEGRIPAQILAIDAGGRASDQALSVVERDQSKMPGGDDVRQEKQREGGQHCWCIHIDRGELCDGLANRSRLRVSNKLIVQYRYD